MTEPAGVSNTDGPAVTLSANRVLNVVVGVCLIIGSVLWTMYWGFVALLPSSFGADGGGRVLVSGGLVLGLIVLVVGISVVRGRSQVVEAGLPGVL